MDAYDWERTEANNKGKKIYVFDDKKTKTKNFDWCTKVEKLSSLTKKKESNTRNKIQVTKKLY